MKKTLLIFLWVVAGIIAANAQEKEKPDVNKMVEGRVDNMKSQLNLTDAESKTFWTAYEQYLQSEVKYHGTFVSNLEKKGIKGCCPNCPSGCDDLTDTQITYLYDQKLELRKDLLNLESSFHKNIKSILTPKHLQEFYKIDERYKRGFIDKGKGQQQPSAKSGTASSSKQRR